MISPRDYEHILASVLAGDACTTIAGLIPGESEALNVNGLHLWFGRRQYANDIYDGYVPLAITYRTDHGIEIPAVAYVDISVFVVDGGYPVRFYIEDERPPVVARAASGIRRALERCREDAFPLLRVPPADLLSESMLIAGTAAELILAGAPIEDTSDCSNQMYWTGRRAILLPEPIPMRDRVTLNRTMRYLSIDDNAGTMGREGWGAAELLPDLGDVLGHITGSSRNVLIPPELMAKLGDKL